MTFETILAHAFHFVRLHPTISTSAVAFVLGRLSKRRKIVEIEAPQPEPEREPEPEPASVGVLSVGQRGQLLEFEYADVQGEITTRTLGSWYETEHHIEGRCRTAKAHRTFRKDRILGWIDGQQYLVAP